MSPFIWFIRRILALVLGVAGVACGLWLHFTQGDTGGALACIAGAGLIASILINE